MSFAIVRTSLMLTLAAAAVALAAPAAARAQGSAECVDGMAGPYPCENVDLESFVPLPFLGGATGNDTWGWVDPETGKEYAIVGTSHSTGFVDVTDPKNPVIVGRLPTRGVPDFVLWRDIKVDGNYAFIVSEITNSGLQVFDLRKLRDGSPATVFTDDATYDQFNFAHNIFVNEDSDTAYVVGSNTCTSNEGTTEEEDGGLHMVDISDPLNPTFLGCAVVNTADDDPGAAEGARRGSNNYSHDVQCVIYSGPDPDYQGREICFGSNENAVVIYDVTVKTAPVILQVIPYDSAAYTHQGWLTEDQRYFLFGDELDEQEGTVPNTTTYVLDVGDLDKPGVPKAFLHETNSIDHNLYNHQGCSYQSNYMAGLRILEYDDASLAAGQLNEVAFFDVVPGGDVPEFAGTWSNYPYFPSGIVTVSTIENEISGLFVLRPRFGEGVCSPPPAGGDPPPPSDDDAKKRRCGGKQATMLGTPGDDKLFGTGKRDVIKGFGGDDEIRGRGGRDIICAGGGRDVSRGGTEPDLNRGGAGRDDVHGNGAEDELRGGAGADTLRGHGGDDEIRGQKNRDELRGNTGDDDLAGHKGGDHFHGGSGTDRCRGGPGTNVYKNCANH